MARKILGIAGSLRKESYNRATLETLAAREWDGFTVEVYDIGSIPLYNADLEENLPQEVRDFKQAIADSDGLLVISPEYNYGIPGVLKNALDWASRPGYKSVLVDKPVGIITCSMATTGGARAQAQIRDTFYATLAKVVPYPEVAVPSAKDKFEDGKLTDAKTLELASGLVNALAKAAQ